MSSFTQESSGGNKILSWAGDAATTRRKVSFNERKEGLQISYKPDDEDWVNEQYIGTSYLDDEWVKDDNWVKFSTDKDVKSLSNTILKELVKLGINYDNIEHYISDNILPVEGWEQGFINTNTGLPTGDDNYITSPFININAGTYVLCSYSAGLISKKELQILQHIVMTKHLQKFILLVLKQIRLQYLKKL